MAPRHLQTPVSVWKCFYHDPLVTGFGEGPRPSPGAWAGARGPLGAELDGWPGGGLKSSLANWSRRGDVGSERLGSLGKPLAVAWLGPKVDGMKTLLVFLSGSLSPLVMLAQTALGPANSSLAVGAKSGAAGESVRLAEPGKAEVEKVKAEARAKAEAKAKADAAKKAADAKKEVGKIDGFQIARGDRGYLGLQIVNSTFKLSFYDAKKKPIAPDVASAVLRWSVTYQKQPERALLTVSGGALASEKSIRPPYAFKLSILLLKEAVEGGPTAGEGAGESFSVDFSQ